MPGDSSVLHRGHRSIWRMPDEHRLRCRRAGVLPSQSRLSPRVHEQRVVPQGRSDLQHGDGRVRRVQYEDGLPGDGTAL
jgi:hypothetical protein